MVQGEAAGCETMFYGDRAGEQIPVLHSEVTVFCEENHGHICFKTKKMIKTWVKYS